MALGEVTPLQTLPDGTVLIECGYCEGTGQAPSAMMNDDWRVVAWHSGSACRVCKGRSMMRFTINGVAVRDGACKGTGRRVKGVSGSVRPGWLDISDTPCVNCHGDGIVAAYGEVRKMGMT